MPSKYKTQSAIDRRRIQSRNNQRRYREETRSYLTSLETDVQDLLHSTFRLEGQVDMMRTTAARLPSRFAGDVNRVKAYWELFAHGYAAAADQDALLRDLMAENVQMLGSTGVDAVLDQWRRYANAFSSFRKVAHTFEAIAVDSTEHIVCVSGSLQLGLDRSGIESLWPHVAGKDKLLDQLLGETLVCPCVQVLYMRPVGDCTKVFRIDFEWDLVGGLTALLRDLEDVAIVINGGHNLFSGDITPVTNKTKTFAVAVKADDEREYM
ncbi:hypothetical protein ACHHYP_06866 [Achlya hypogyna]|uniref:BZIP domain-containing protein n=1 Tax=Achlya hypogyna TaxID=1202772 RepID=A0A1V9YRH0_ACHHY|nr:hypothetical protein ACHHYP_06866 [Achlya hypogyna]